MWTIKEVTALVPKLDNPVGKCQKAVTEASMVLSRQNIEHRPIEGRFEGWRLDGGTGESYHWYIQIHGSQLESGDTVVLDPTVNQFRRTHSREDGVKTVVPDTVHPDESILTQEDDLYEAYCAVHPQSTQ